MKTLQKSLVLLAIVVVILLWIFLPGSKTAIPNEGASPLSSETSGQCSTQVVEADIESFANRDSGSTYAEDKRKYQSIEKKISRCEKDGKFSRFADENTDCGEALRKKLFDAYRDKFIAHAQSTFENFECEIKDLEFISDEYKELRKKEIRGAGDMNSLFAGVDDIIQVYDSIGNLIKSCHKLSPRSDDKFPIDSVKNMIEKVKRYQSATFILGNDRVALCERIKDTLGEISQILFDKHADFLNGKIDKSLETYEGFNLKQDYNDAVWEAVNNDINGLCDRYNRYGYGYGYGYGYNRYKYKDIYGVPADTLNRRCDELNKRWDEERNRSEKYFRYGKEILNKLKTDALDSAVLERYKNTDVYETTKKLAASIDLYLEFWALDGKNDKTYKNLYAKVIKDDNMKSSKLRHALKELSSNDASYEGFYKLQILTLSRQD